jgi:hypothetical protein
MQYEGQDFAIEKFLYHNEVNLLADKTFIRNNNDSLCVDYNESEDILITKDFIISVINSDILTDLNIPVISVSIIRKTDFM